MSRIVLCKKYNKEMEGLVTPPYPGAKGQDIFDNISKQAWQEWQTLQTMLINEKHLKLSDPETRKYLFDQMWRFFENKPVDAIEGYIPPS